MNESNLRPSEHDAIRTILRIGGPILAVAGLLLTIIGISSFFASFGSFEAPRYFWCAFLGMPLLFAGLVMCKFGFLGTITRYIAGETAPVIKDTTNYLGDGIQPGVKAVAKAVTEGVIEAQKEARQKP